MAERSSASDEHEPKTALAVDADVAGLAELGHKQELKRQYGLISAIALGVVATNTWSALGGSLTAGIYSGGPAVVIYGFLLTTLANVFVVLSLAELSSSYPTAGGAYHWAAVIAPSKWSRPASFLTGYLNLFAWIVGTAGSTLVLAQFVIALANLVNSDFFIERWMVFVCYQVFNVLSTTYGVYGNALMPFVIRFALFWTMTACFTSIIVMLAVSSPKQSTTAVFAVFNNYTGWSNDGIAVMVGLITPAFGYAAVDATVHFSEEVQDPERNVPRSLMAILGVGFISGMAFLLSLFFSVTDITGTFDTATGLPIVEMYRQACGEKGGIALTIFLFFATIPALLDCQVATSRLLWAFARDDAIPFSGIFKKVDKKTNVPVYASLLVGLCLALLGCIYIGNTTAFNAFISSSIVLNYLTYVLPVLINMLQGRKNFRRGKFTLNGIIGWVVNGLMCAWVLFIVVFFEFPSFMPVTAENMNYTVVLLGACLFFAATWWFIRGYQSYTGPTVEVLLDSINGEDVIHEAPREESSGKV